MNEQMNKPMYRIRCGGCQKERFITVEQFEHLKAGFEIAPCRRCGWKPEPKELEVGDGV